MRLVTPKIVLIFAVAGGAQVAEAVPVKERGAGLIDVAEPLVICKTARPRSFTPSARKRNTPSAPLKPDRFAITLSE